ncbi:MAG: sigma-70 family RNA polymerase sigma factor [Planctomycetota bacterium]
MSSSFDSSDAVLENLDWVRGLARALLRDDAAADDLVQETWLRAQGVDVPAGPARRRWLGRVVRNLARDRFRRQVRRNERELSAARSEALPSNAELHEAAEVREQLARWVKELPEPYRRVALLHWLEGHDPREIASRDGRPIATVRSQLARARQLLRERARRSEREGAASWLAVAAGIPPERFASAAATTTASIPLAGWILMKTGACVAAACLALAAVLFVAQFFGSGERPAALPSNATVSANEPSSLPAGTADVERLEVESRRFAVASDAADALGAPDAQVPETARRALRVLVQDPDRAPVGGAPVALVAVGGNGSTELWTGETDAPSGAVAVDVDPDEVARQTSRASTVRLEVGLVLPGLDLERVAFDLEAIPEDPVVLTMPAHGSLTVRIEDSGGEPVTDHPWLHVTPLFEHPSEPGRLKRGERHSTPMADRSEVTVPFVAAGAELRVQVHQKGVYEGTHRVVEALADGEHRTVTLVTPRTVPFATGRIEVAGAEGASPSYFDVELEPGGSERVYELGSDGSFVLPLADVRAQSGATFTAQIVAQVLGRTGGWQNARTYTASFQALMPAQGRSVDVGTITLRPPSVLAAGRVLDAGGQPVHRAYVSIYEKFNQRADPEDFGWNFAGVPYTYTDENGAFEVQYDKPEGEYAIRAHAPGSIDRGAVRFQAGARNLVLTVDRERHLRGSVRLPDGFDPTDLVVRAEVVGATREERAYARFESAIATDGDFWLRGLRAAEARVQLLRPDSETPLAILDGVRPTLDPEELPGALDPWDCRPFLRHLSFEVLRADGSPAPQALTIYDGRSLPVERGRVDAIVTTAEVDEVFVVAPGHRPTRFPTSAAPERVRLERGIPVEVAWSRPLPPAPEGVEVWVGLRPKETSWIPEPAEGEFPYDRYLALWMGEALLVAGSSSATVHVSVPGRYRPLWRVVHPTEDVVLDGTDDRYFRSVTGRYDVEVDVRGSTAARQVVEPDLEAARKALERPE